MDELTRSLAWFRPEIALTAGLLLVVLADSFLRKGRNLVTRLLQTVSSVEPRSLESKLSPARLGEGPGRCGNSASQNLVLNSCNSAGILCSAINDASEKASLVSGAL
jgi:hypothetical protein